MKAAILLAPNQIEIREVAEPEASPGHVLIRPTRVGVCGSDVSFFAGHRQPPYLPFLLGHEGVGRIVAVGQGVTSLAVGQRVIVEPNYPCGTCAFCRAGRGAICPNKISMGVSVPGCFSELAAAPAEYVWAMPDAVSDADAATIEPLCVSLHALLLSGARLGDTIVVLGCGATGLLLIQVAVMQGIHVLAYDKFDEKLEMARRLGAVTPDGKDGEAEWTNANVSTVFECAGVTATAERALSAVPRGGQVVLLGLATAPASFIPLGLVRKGIRVLGSIIYDHPFDFARAIALVAAGGLHPSQIVTDTLPLDQIGRALALACTGESGKIHVEI